MSNDKCILSKFTVAGYRNFVNRTCVDLTDVHRYDFNTGCIEDGRLFKTVVLGRNGSGKTNLGLALFDIVYTLTENPPHPLQLQRSAFLNCGFSGKYATFVYEFSIGSETVVYEYRKMSPRHIVYESLHVDGRPVFIRDGLGDTSDYSGLKKHGVGITGTDIPNGPLSVLRFVYNNSIHRKNTPITGIMDFVSRMLYIGSARDGYRHIGLTDDEEPFDTFILSHGLVEEFQGFLKDFAGTDVELGRRGIPGMADVLVLGSGNRAVPFSDVCSPGTEAAMAYFRWSRYFGDVSFLYLDGLDAHCHCGLSERILKDLIGRRGLQCMVTTQDTGLVDNRFLRPDCYLLMVPDGVRSMPRLTTRL
ncbi:MAG: ATP-binding protein, partial [archaeon]|nr:ATP-binding protein [archaeon]